MSFISSELLVTAFKPSLSTIIMAASKEIGMQNTYSASFIVSAWLPDGSMIGAVLGSLVWGYQMFILQVSHIHLQKYIYCKNSQMRSYNCERHRMGSSQEVSGSLLYPSWKVRHQVYWCKNVMSHEIRKDIISCHRPGEKGHNKTLQKRARPAYSLRQR